jgi:acetyl-CoA carboxylase alpha subunit
VPVYTENDVHDREYAIIQPLSATSCKNLLWEPSPTQEDATDQLRVKAARLGGNGLLNVTCEAPSGTSLITNCWSSLTCHGAAIKVTR